MPVSFNSAIAAYNSAARAMGAPGAEARPTAPGFAELLRGIADDTIAAGRAGEQASLQAVAGKTELADVVTAVTNAEVALQTVVAVRDRVIQAYQDILRMPI